MRAGPFVPRRAAAALAALVGLGLAAAAAGRTASARVPRAPRLPFTLSAAAQARLAAAGPADRRVRVVMYAGDQCPHCHVEAARWARLAASDPDLVRPLQVVFVVASARDRAASASTTGTTLGAPVVPPFAYLADPGARLAPEFRARVVPTTLVVDEAGAVRAYSVGEHSDSALRTLARAAAPQFPPRPAPAGDGRLLTQRR